MTKGMILFDCLSIDEYETRKTIEFQFLEDDRSKEPSVYIREEISIYATVIDIESMDIPRDEPLYFDGTIWLIQDVSFYAEAQADRVHISGVRK